MKCHECGSKNTQTKQTESWAINSSLLKKYIVPLDDKITSKKKEVYAEALLGAFYDFNKYKVSPSWFQRRPTDKHLSVTVKYIICKDCGEILKSNAKEQKHKVEILFLEKLGKEILRVDEEKAVEEFIMMEL